VVGTIAGLSLVANLSKTSRNAAIIVGALTIAAAVLSALEQKVGFQAIAEKHRTASGQFVAVRSNFNHFAATWTDPTTAADELAAIEDKWNDVQANAEPVEEWTGSIVDEMRRKTRA
jgi:hypothetical protein